MGKLTTSSIHNEMDEPISNRPKNVHCVELKDIIIIIVHIIKLTTNIISIFQFYVYLICIVHFILMYYVVFFILITIFITKLFSIVNIKIILSNKIN